ncbi:MAG: ExbD/TolR family protein [Prochloraceae cyanobacterium]
MRLPDERDRAFEINLVPAIDIIFSILAFLIISTLSLTRSSTLPVNLPSAKTAATQSQKSIYITIDAEGKIFFQDKAISLEKLTDRLKKSISSDSPKLVIIEADATVNHGLVVKIMDRFRQIEGVKLAIAVKKDED